MTRELALFLGSLIPVLLGIVCAYFGVPRCRSKDCVTETLGMSLVALACGLLIIGMVCAGAAYINLANTLSSVNP